MNQKALNAYKSVDVQSGITDATPHQLVAMLISGALDRVASAKGAVSRGEISRKGELVSSVIAIIDSLRATLDHEKGGEISQNLASLYDYIERTLVQANLASDVTLLDEVSRLLTEIKEGWESIPAEARQV
ncbi:MAG: flagellar protein FliS [Halioglobus sp.]|jgi:flagellar protein FliS